MSINAEIWSRINEGRLVELRPPFATENVIRKMYLENDLYDEVYRTRSEDAEIKRYAQLQADLELFLTSENIDPKYLFGLSPARDGVWEIRSVRPKPSIRVFGLFAKNDTFIATHHIERVGLGGWNSREWNMEIRRARTIWRQLFPAHDPDNSGDVIKLVRGAIDGKYFK